MGKIRSYNGFLFEGHREQAKIDELLDASRSRRLTDDEKDLLRRLSMGEKLPDDVLKTHKTGGLLLDDQGKPMVQDDDTKKDKGGEFFTEKGKSRSADKVEQKLNTIILDARVYRNKKSEERFFFVYIKDEKPHWAIYRTGASDKYPLGQFMNTDAPKFEHFNKKTPEQFWSDNDQQFDYGMILDNELYQMFLNFMELLKDDRKNRNEITKIRNRFLTLL